MRTRIEVGTIVAQKFGEGNDELSFCNNCPKGTFRIKKSNSPKTNFFSHWRSIARSPTTLTAISFSPEIFYPTNPFECLFHQEDNEFFKQHFEPKLNGINVVIINNLQHTKKIEITEKLLKLFPLCMKNVLGTSPRHPLQIKRGRQKKRSDP